MGVIYHKMNHVLVGWQADDLPLFSQIQNILVIGSEVMLNVLMCITSGIDRHYHSFVITKTSNVSYYWLSELVENQVFQAHLMHNYDLCVTF